MLSLYDMHYIKQHTLNTEDEIHCYIQATTRNKGRLERIREYSVTSVYERFAPHWIRYPCLRLTVRLRVTAYSLLSIRYITLSAY